MKEKRQDSLSPNLRKYYEARQEMNDWLEKDDVPEDTKATMYAQQLQRVNQLKNQVFRPEPSPVQMITQMISQQFNPIQYGLFLKHYGMGGPLWPPL